MVVSKYMALDISSADDVLTQTNARSTLTGYAPFLIQDDANVFNVASDDDAVVLFELTNMTDENVEELINGLIIGEYINTTSDGHVIIKTEFMGNESSFMFQSQGNFSEGCFEATILYRTLNEDGNSDNPRLADGPAQDRYYAYHGTDYFPDDTTQSPYDSFSSIFKICIFQSGATPAPTPPPITTSAPTPRPNIPDCRFKELVLQFEYILVKQQIVQDLVVNHFLVYKYLHHQLINHWMVLVLIQDVYG